MLGLKDLLKLHFGQISIFLSQSLLLTIQIQTFRNLQEILYLFFPQVSAARTKKHPFALFSFNGDHVCALMKHSIPSGFCSLQCISFLKPFTLLPLRLRLLPFLMHLLFLHLIGSSLDRGSSGMLRLENLACT